MIQNIVFDMGGVIIRFDRPLFISRLGVSQEDAPILLNQVYRSVEWAMMDRGTLSEQEAARSICTRLPERLHDAAHKLVFLWERPLLPIDGMYELIEEIKALGYPVCIY